MDGARCALCSGQARARDLPGGVRWRGLAEFPEETVGTQRGPVVRWGAVAKRKTEIKRFLRELPKPARTLVLVLEDVEDPVNVGSVFRVADALKVQEVVLTGITARPPHKLITRVGRAKDQRVKWRSAASAPAVLEELKADGFVPYAVELNPQAKAYHEVDYADRVALVVGHEDHGVTKKTLAVCPNTIFLPMYGKGGSLNVAAALTVAAYRVLHP